VTAAIVVVAVRQRIDGETGTFPAGAVDHQAENEVQSG